MKIETKQVTKHVFSDLRYQDTVSIVIEDEMKGWGSVTITKYGSAWTGSWNAMGDRTVTEFFLHCDNDYLCKNLGVRDREIYDYSAEPIWNEEGGYSHQPRITNPEYIHLCKVIEVVKEGLKQIKPEIKDYGKCSECK